MIFGTLINDIARYDSIIAKIIESGNEIDKIINLTKGLSEAESISVMTKAGLNEKTIEHIQAMKLDSSAKAKDIIATNAQTNAQISNMGVVEVLKLKYQGLAASIGISTAALTTLIGVGIGLAGVGVALFKIAQVADEVAERANTLSEEFNSSSTSIDDFKKQIDKLHAVINDDTSSFEEVKEARISLLSVQDEMISKFGDEKEVIDIVTDAINNQSSALDRLTNKEWKDTLNDFNKEGFWNGLANRLAGYSNNVERMLASYRDYSVDVDLTGLMAKFTEDKYGEFTELITNKFGATILPEVGVATFTGNASEIYDTLLEIQNLSDEFDFGDAFNRQLTKAANNTKDVVSEYEGMYNQYILYEEVLPNYAEQYNQLTGAYKEYKEAWSSGDVGAQDKAIESLSNILQDASDNIDNKYVVDFFENMYPDLQSVIDKWNFKVNILPNFDTHALSGMSKANLIEMIQTDGLQYGEQTLNSIVDLAYKHKIITDKSNDSILKLIDLLVEWGVLQDDITEKVVNTSAAFDDIFALEDSEGKINALGELNEQLDNIQNAYKNLKDAMDTYSETGYITIDQFQAIIEQGSKFLDYLTLEDGQLAMNEQAMYDLAEARIVEMKAKMIQGIIDNVNQIQSETDATKYLATTNYELAEATNVAAEAELRLWATNSLLATESKDAVVEKARNDIAKINALVANINLGSIGGDSAKDAADAAKDYVDAYMSYMEASLNASKIDYQTYSREVAAFLKDMFDQGKISAEDYHNYVKQMLEVQQDAMDKVISAVTRRLDLEIEFYEKQIDDIDERYQKEIDYIDTLIEQHEEQKQKLQDENDERDRQLELEKALYNLRRAETQRVFKLYTGEKGYNYVADADAIRESSDEVYQAKLDIEISKIDESIKKLEKQQEELQKAMDKEKEQLQEIIDRLTEYRDKWQEVADEYEIQQNELMAAQILGAGWEADILNGRLDTLNNFKDEYIAIQKAIADATYEAAKANYEEAGKEVKKSKPDSKPEEHGTRYKVVNAIGGAVVAYYDAPEGKGLDEEALAKANARKEEEIRRSGEPYIVDIEEYAKGGKNLKKQIAWTNEYDDEAILSPSRNAILTPIKAGDSVLNPEMTKNLWKWAEINPNMFNPLVKSMDYNNIPIRNDVQPLTISIGDIQLYGVQDVNDLGNQIVKRLPNVMLQAINKR